MGPKWSQKCLNTHETCTVYCSQNCRIDWNTAMLCFKWLFHIRVWTFARFVRPLFATILCTWEIWSTAYTMYHIFPCWQKKKKMAEKNKKFGRITAPTLKPTDDQKPETFLFGLMCNFLLNLLYGPKASPLKNCLLVSLIGNVSICWPKTFIELYVNLLKSTRCMIICDIRLVNVYLFVKSSFYFVFIFKSCFQHGLVGGVMQVLLLHMSAHLTKELGMAPGGEFRKAFKEVQLATLIYYISVYINRK